MPVVVLPPVTPLTCQVTAVLLEPVTVDVNVCVPNVLKFGLAGCTLTVTLPPVTVPLGSPLQAARTATVAIPNTKVYKRRMGTPGNQLQFSS